MVEEWRVEFDAEVTFLNGGGLQAQGFRLDIPGTDIADEALADLFVHSLRLLMVEQVRFTNRRLLREPHKGSRGTEGGSSDPRTRRLIELSHIIRDGMVTYPGLPAVEITGHLSREASRAHYAPGCEFHIGRINMVANTGTYLDTPFHRYAEGADLARIPLGSLVDLDGLVIRLLGSPQKAINRAALLPYEVAGRAVLFPPAGMAIGVPRNTARAIRFSQKMRPPGWWRRARRSWGLIR